jgi:hypothetical protein
MYKIAEINFLVRNNEIKQMFVPLFQGEFDTFKDIYLNNLKDGNVSDKYIYPEGFYPICVEEIFTDIETAKKRIEKHKVDFTKHQILQANLGIVKIHTY